MYDNTIAIEVIRDALELIASPKRWTHGARARNKTTDKHVHPLGEPCPPWSVPACKWDAFGAIERCAIDCENYQYLLRILSEIEKDCQCSLIDFNDSSTHERVISLLNRTLKRLSASQQFIEARDEEE